MRAFQRTENSAWKRAFGFLELEVTVYLSGVSTLGDLVSRSGRRSYECPASAIWASHGVFDVVGGELDAVAPLDALLVA